MVLNTTTHHHRLSSNTTNSKPLKPPTPLKPQQVNPFKAELTVSWTYNFGPSEVGVHGQSI